MNSEKRTKCFFFFYHSMNSIQRNILFDILLFRFCENGVHGDQLAAFNRIHRNQNRITRRMLSKNEVFLPVNQNF